MNWMLQNLTYKIWNTAAAYTACTCVWHLYTDGQHASLVNINTLLTTDTTTKNTVTNKPNPQAGQIANTHNLFTQNIHHYFDYFSYFLFDASVTS